MKKTKLLWDMPITIEVVDPNTKAEDINEIYKYFRYIDDTFSTFKKTSEISAINRGKITKDKWSRDMKDVFRLCEKTRKETNGYFNIFRNGKYDPLGIVKGWAIKNASDKLKVRGYENFYINAGGDIQVAGKNKTGEFWKVGIQNPFKTNENIKILSIYNKGVATSGIYIRGQHIENPYNPKGKITDIVSLTVIGPDIFEADRIATAAFAMGEPGINFIEHLKGFEGYMIDIKGIATYTTGFENYVHKNH
jgi:thiamine biosynthesis lipoprotein